MCKISHSTSSLFPKSMDLSTKYAGVWTASNWHVANRKISMIKKNTAKPAIMPGDTHQFIRDMSQEPMPNERR